MLGPGESWPGCASDSTNLFFKTKNTSKEAMIITNVAIIRSPDKKCAIGVCVLAMHLGTIV